MMMAHIFNISSNLHTKTKPTGYFIFSVTTYICLGFSVSEVGSRFRTQTLNGLIPHTAVLFILPYISSHVICTADNLLPRQTHQDITPDQVEYIRNSISGESTEKSLPQILPIASTTTPSPNSQNVFSTTDKNESKIISIFIDFISDFASYNEWTQVYLFVPQMTSRNVSVVCNYLSNALLRTKVSLQSKCGSESEMITSLCEVSTTTTGKVQTGKRDKVFPIISFYFMPTDNFFSRAIHPQFLINYMKSRPIYVLGVHPNKTQIIDQLQPEILINYKWTLVSYSERTITSSSIKSSEVFIELDDIYGFGSSLDPLPVSLGNWSVSRGLQIDLKHIHGPSDFQGRKLRITTVVGQPVVYVDQTLSGKVKGRGYLPDIMETISRKLNFTYELMVPADKKFGNDDGTGNWSGMVGLLQRKEAEIAMMSFSLTAQRHAVMDFSPAVEYSSVRLLIRKDWQNAELKWSAYLQPLETNVWVAVPLCIILGVATLAFFAHWKVFTITPGTSLWLLSSCFVLQGQGQEGHDSIKVTPYRLVIGTFWMLSLVVFACYTARLTSFLAATTENLPVKSLAEAVKLKSWKVGLVKGSAFLDRIKESRVDVLRSLSKKLTDDPSGLVDSFQEGMDRVYTDRFVFFTSELIPSFLIKGNCSYTWLPDRYYSGFGYMGYQKGLPYAAVISHKVAELRSSGQMRKLFLKWWGTESLCFLSNSGDLFLGMSLYETGTAFLLLVFGISFSIVLLLGEISCRLRKSRISTMKDTASLANQNESMASGYPFGDQTSHSGVQDLVRSHSTQNFGIHTDSEPYGYYSYDSGFTHSLQNKIKGHIFR